MGLRGEENNKEREVSNQCLPLNIQNEGNPEKKLWPANILKIERKAWHRSPPDKRRGKKSEGVAFITFRGSEKKKKKR